MVNSKEQQQWFKEAVEAHQAGQLQKASDCYRKVLSLKPQHADALHLLGVVALQVKQYSQAERLISKALQQRPGEAVYLNSLGSLYRTSGQLSRAMGVFQQALQSDPVCADTHNNLGVVLRDQGDNDGAMSAYARALELAPRHADAHSNSGSLLLDLGKLSEAEKSLRYAIELAPRHADANYNLGLVLRLGGHFEEAVKYLNFAVSYQPVQLQGYLELGRTLHELQRFAEAERCFREALSYQPDSTPTKLAYAQTLLRLDRADDALQLLTDVTDDDANSALFLNVRGLVLRALGQLDTARDAFAQALSIDPQLPAARFNLATVNRETRLDPIQVDTLLRQAEDSAAPDDARASAYFTLGKLHDDAAAYTRAFMFYQAANRFRTGGYSRAEHEHLVDRIIDIFDASLFERMAGGGSSSEQPIFIVGMPRSGTTLTEQILASHGSVLGAGERAWVPRLANRELRRRMGTALSYPDYLSELPVDLLSQAADTFTQGLPEAAAGMARVTDKLPGNLLYLGLIALLFPNARVIHTRRNALDTCLSCFFQNFQSGLPFAFDLEDLGHYYRQYERLMAHWRKVLPLRMMETDYEVLVQQQELVSRRLIEFVGLEWDRRCLDFYQNTRAVYTASVWQVRQPVYHSSINRWRHYQPHLKSLQQLV